MTSIPTPSPASTVLITGPSSGIGRDLAELFVRGGCDLVLVARRQEVLETLATQWRRQYGRRIEVMPADLVDPAAPQGVFDETARRGLSVDILVNNAGFGSHGPFAGMDIARELSMVQVNAASLMHLTRLFLPQMIERNRGRILNVASLAGFVPGPYMSTYYATKAFVVSHSLALRAELRKTGVSVTLLCPGPVHTEFQERAGMKRAKLFSAASVMQSVDVARAGYDGCLRGRALVVPGWSARLSLAALRWLPRRLATRIVADRNRLR